MRNLTKTQTRLGLGMNISKTQMYRSLRGSDSEDFIMFVSHECYFSVADKPAISILRLGLCSEETVVKYRVSLVSSRDNAILPFKSYVDTITFPANDDFETLVIDLDRPDNAAWEMLEHFKVELLEVVKGKAKIGPGPECFVYILDEHGFPEDFRDIKHPIGHPAGPSYILLAKSFISLRWGSQWKDLSRCVAVMAWAPIHSILKELVRIIIVNHFILAGLNDIAAGSKAQANNPAFDEQIGDGRRLADANTTTTSPQNVYLDDANYQLLISMGLLYIVANLIAWLCDRGFKRWCKVGSTLKLLRVWLVQKYVWFSEATHVTVDARSCFDAQVIDVAEDIAMKLWLQHLRFIGDMMNLIVQIIFAFGLCIQQGVWWIPFPVILLLPAAAVVVLCRSSAFLKLVEVKTNQTEAWNGELTDIMKNWPLVNWFNLRTEAVERFRATYDLYRDAERRVAYYRIDTNWITRLVNEAMVACGLVGGAYLARERILSVGAFVALVSVTRTVGKLIVSLMNRLVVMQEGAKNLEQVCISLNERTGIAKVVHMQRRTQLALEEGSKIGLQIDQHRDEGTLKLNFVSALNMFSQSANIGFKVKVSPALDTRQKLGSLVANTFFRLRDIASVALAAKELVSCILLEDVSYRYPKVAGSTLDSGASIWAPAITQQLSCKLPLGHTFVCLDVPPSGGVLTLMKLMTGQLHQDSGLVKVPAHLKTLLVGNEPQLLNHSLWFNLTIGAPDLRDEDDGCVKLKDQQSVHRVWAIAKALGFSSQLLFQPDFSVGPNGMNLTLFMRTVVSLVRALVSDAHILVLYKPLVYCSESQRKVILQVLKDWADGNGIFKAAEPLRTEPERPGLFSSEEEPEQTQIGAVSHKLTLFKNTYDLTSRNVFIAVMGPVPLQCSHSVRFVPSVDSSGNKTMQGIVSRIDGRVVTPFKLEPQQFH